MNTFICSVCKEKKTNDETIATGYGLDKHNKKVCYECCAIQDKESMKKYGSIALYLNHVKQIVTNWPSSLTFSCSMTTGKHNIAGIRRDAWFTFNGHIWHGTQYGDFTDIIHCKQTKQLA